MVVMVAQETCKHPTLKIGESVNFVMYVYHNLKIKGGGYFPGGPVAKALHS